jgi:hypothetical protein
MIRVHHHAWLVHSGFVSQHPVTIMKYLRQLTYKEKMCILTSGSGGSSPRLNGLIALGLWQIQTIGYVTFQDLVHFPVPSVRAQKSPLHPKNN